MKDGTISIEQLLAAEIKAVQKRIKKLIRDPATLEFWDIGEKRGPKITIGADIECLLELYDREDGQWLKLRELPVAECLTFEKYFLKALKKFCERPPEFDGDLYELNPHPGRPQAMIRRYLTLKKHFEAVAKDQGLHHRMGQGHWHLSLQSPEDKRFFNIRHPFMFQLACRQLLDQLEAPALFVKPRQAELGTNMGASRAEVSWQSSTSICASFNKYPNGAPHYEMRLAHMAPYLPVLLILSAIERTLKSRPDNIVLPPQGSGFLINAPNSEYIRIEPPEKFKVEREPYAYMEFFRIMEESRFLEKLWPEAAAPLKVALMRDYHDFLTNLPPLRHPDYTAKRKTPVLKAIAHKIKELEGKPGGLGLAAPEKT